MKITFFFLLTFFTFQTSFEQKAELIPKGFVKLEGLLYVGNITFYLNEKTKTILALQDDNIKWKRNIITACGKPFVGKNKIRSIRIKNKYLNVIYGKHNFANIEVETGNVICGAD